MIQNPKKIYDYSGIAVYERTDSLAIWRVFTCHRTFIQIFKIARKRRFVCLRNEHGVAISMKAKKEGITPQEVIDKYDGIKSFSDFGISFDNYSRTSAKIHHDTASEF
jgi:hypothetical protein